MATPSALTNAPGQPLGTLTKEAFSDFIETNFQEIHEDLAKSPVQGLALYNEESTNLDHVKETGLVGLGTMPRSRDSQKLPLDAPIQGFDLSTTPETFRLAVRIEDRLRETAQYGLITKLQRALSQAARDTIEYNAALPFNSTFGSTVPFLCADGLALVDTARNLENKSGTWTNQETGAALTQNSLETMDNNFAATVNGRGLLRPLAMKNLVVPRRLRRKALELTQSDKRPEDSLNAKNVFRGAFDVIVWDYLSSATAWFGTIDMNSTEYQLGWLWGAKQNIKTWADGSNCDLFWHRIRMVFATKCYRAHGIRGNAGA
jgi:hypothetical protein